MNLIRILIYKSLFFRNPELLQVGPRPRFELGLRAFYKIFSILFFFARKVFNFSACTRACSRLRRKLRFRACQKPFRFLCMIKLFSNLFSFDKPFLSKEKVFHRLLCFNVRGEKRWTHASHASFCLPAAVTPPRPSSAKYNAT